MLTEDFDRCYAEHAPTLLAFLVYRTGDPQLAEDVVADTFERVLRGRSRFDRLRGSEKTWIFSIALNRLTDLRRREASQARAFGQLDPADSSHEQGWTDRIGDQDAVRRGLAGLSEEEREAIALRFGADLTMPEMTRLLGIRQTTVEGRVYRALEKLRGLIDDQTGSG